MEVLLANGNGPVGRGQHIRQGEVHPLVIPDRQGVDLAFRCPGTRDHRLVGVVQYELGQRLPGRRVLEQVVSLCVLHDADAPELAQSSSGREVFPAYQQVAFVGRVPEDLVAEIGGPARHRQALVVKAPVDPVGGIAQPGATVLAAPVRVERHLVFLGMPPGQPRVDADGDSIEAYADEIPGSFITQDGHR